MSKYNRQKGHSFEREIAKDFRELGFENAITTRNARGGDWSRSDDGIDLTGTEPYAVQCKRMAAYCSVNTIEEIHADPVECTPCIVGVDPTTGGMVFQKGNPIELIPLLLTKANNKPIMAVIAWEDLKYLIKLNK